MRPPLFTLLCWFAAATLAMLSPAQADDQPQGRVLLEISGAIANPNGDGGVRRYDRAMLEALGTHEILTETPWTDGETRFEGVLARDLMADSGAEGDVIDAIALNDYTVSIPVMDFDTYGVILAYRRDGAELTVRDRGPLWIIYPWSDVPDLQNELYYSRSIWQLRAIEVRQN